MNVYDCAHQLARAIKNSKEYKEFVRLNEEINNNPQLKDMIKDFREKQLELQKDQLMGKEVDKSKLEKIQELFKIINKDPKANEYFQAELRFNQMMTDISKILDDIMQL